jgi:hypothetical protein
MAYPTNTLGLVLDDTDRRVVGLKQYCAALRGLAAAGNVTSSQILDLMVGLHQDRVALAAAAATPGIGPYAQAQKNAPGLDIAAEFNNLLAGIDGAISWITANFPKDANGFLLAQNFGGPGGTPLDRQFTPAQTAGLRTALDSLTALIN